MANGDNELPQMRSEIMTARDVENQVIQEVLRLLTNTELQEECDVNISAAESKLSDQSTLQEWRVREQQLLDKIVSLEAQQAPPVEGEKTKAQVNVELTRKLKDQNEELRATLAKMAVLLKDKTGMCATQESKISAMASQVTSLKEVVAITKDLLNIRNMEVTHLSRDIHDMQTKIDDERTRHNELLARMEKMISLNGALKAEYQTQLKIFQELREKYDAKMKIVEQQQQQQQANQQQKPPTV